MSTLYHDRWIDCTADDVVIRDPDAVAAAIREHSEADIVAGGKVIA